MIALLIGVVSGVSGGLFGIGGGVIMVPAMVLLLQFNQQKAQGTSLAALLLPVGILGVAVYSQAKAIDLKVATFIAIGFLAGAYLGSKVSISLDEVLLRRLFAGFLVVLAVLLVLQKPDTEIQPTIEARAKVSHEV